MNTLKVSAIILAIICGMIFSVTECLYVLGGCCDPVARLCNVGAILFGLTVIIGIYSIRTKSLRLENGSNISVEGKKEGEDVVDN